MYRNVIFDLGNVLLNFKPEESIFIDDVEADIEGARKLNFEAILFKNPKDLREA